MWEIQADKIQKYMRRRNADRGHDYAPVEPSVDRPEKNPVGCSRSSCELIEPSFPGLRRQARKNSGQVRLTLLLGWRHTMENGTERPEFSKITDVKQEGSIE